MDTMFATAAMSAPSLVLRYAAAFFFVVVAIFLAYMLFKAAKALERLDRVLADVDDNGIPLMKKAGTTLDGVNANLGNVDEITKDVAGITDKLDKMASTVEGAVTTPARKAAAFGAGVQSAVSSFMKRDRSTDPTSAETADSWGSAKTGSTSTGGWDAEPASAEPAGDADAGSAAGHETAATDAPDDAAVTIVTSPGDAAEAPGETGGAATADASPHGA